MLSFLLPARRFPLCQRACECLPMRWHQGSLCAGLDGARSVELKGGAEYICILFNKCLRYGQFFKVKPIKSCFGQITCYINCFFVNPVLYGSWWAMSGVCVCGKSVKPLTKLTTHSLSLSPLFPFMKVGKFLLLSVVNIIAHLRMWLSDAGGLKKRVKINPLFKLKCQPPWWVGNFHIKSFLFHRSHCENV